MAGSCQHNMSERLLSSECCHGISPVAPSARGRRANRTWTWTWCSGAPLILTPTPCCSGSLQSSLVKRAMWPAGVSDENETKQDCPLQPSWMLLKVTHQRHLVQGLMQWVLSTAGGYQYHHHHHFELTRVDLYLWLYLCKFTILYLVFGTVLGTYKTVKNDFIRMSERLSPWLPCQEQQVPESLLHPILSKEVRQWPSSLWWTYLCFPLLFLCLSLWRLAYLSFLFVCLLLDFSP